MSFDIGQNVKYSECALRSYRDYWQQCGHEPAKSYAKTAYEERKAKRGKVIANLRTASSRRGIRVSFPGGIVVDSLDYIFEKA